MSNRSKITALNSAILASAFIFTSTSAMAANEVNVYSARKEQLIKPVLKEFTKKTGIKVNLVTGKADALLKRLQSEGKHTKADLFLTTDAGRLERAKKAKVLKPIKSSTLNKRIPSHLRDKHSQWYGLSGRSRVIIYNKKRVKPSELSTYEDLASPKWRGRICMRSSSNIYNQSLLASIIGSRGKSYAQQWAKGVVKNFARPPQGNDRSQMKAVAVGECDITVVNSYYYGGWKKSRDPSQRRMSKKVGLFYPNQKDRGTHMNISGAGVTKYGKNEKNAVKLLEFLTTNTAQKFYSKANFEYPVARGVPMSREVKSWGRFKKDRLSMNKLGEYNSTAVKIFDRAGWR